MQINLRGIKIIAISYLEILYILVPTARAASCFSLRLQTIVPVMTMSAVWAKTHLYL